MFVDKKNYKDASNEDNFKVELFIDKFTGYLTYRNALGQKIIVATKNLDASLNEIKNPKLNEIQKPDQLIPNPDGDRAIDYKAQ
jgi:hypothetical protein